MISRILRNFGQVALDFVTLNVGYICHRTFNSQSTKTQHMDVNQS